MIDRLQTKLKDYVSTWGSNVKYYAVGKNNVDAGAAYKVGRLPFFLMHFFKNCCIIERYVLLDYRLAGINS